MLKKYWLNECVHIVSLTVTERTHGNLQPVIQWKRLDGYPSVHTREHFMHTLDNTLNIGVCTQVAACVQTFSTIARFKVFNFGCTLEPPGELLKIPMSRPHPGQQIKSLWGENHWSRWMDSKMLTSGLLPRMGVVRVFTLNSIVKQTPEDRLGFNGGVTSSSLRCLCKWPVCTWVSCL